MASTPRSHIPGCNGMARIATIWGGGGQKDGPWSALPFKGHTKRPDHLDNSIPPLRDRGVQCRPVDVPSSLGTPCQRRDSLEFRAPEFLESPNSCRSFALGFVSSAV